MNPATREKLTGVTVALLCSALYKRCLESQTIQDVRPVRPKDRNMVRPAFTLRYMPARENRNPKHLQRYAIETCPEGHVLVMDSRKNERAASRRYPNHAAGGARWGAGVMTDGGFRDAMTIG